MFSRERFKLVINTSIGVAAVSLLGLLLYGGPMASLSTIDTPQGPIGETAEPGDGACGVAGATLLKVVDDETIIINGPGATGIPDGEKMMYVDESGNCLYQNELPYGSGMSAGQNTATDQLPAGGTIFDATMNSVTVDKPSGGKRQTSDNYFCFDVKLPDGTVVHLQARSQDDIVMSDATINQVNCH